MTQAGEHTWDIITQYHRCPKCGNIIESREDFHNRLGKLVKEITCDRCGNHFLLTKQRRPSFGPLIGSPQPPEITWQ